MSERMVINLGGKPSKKTPADMRLAANKKKYGSVANRDAGKPATQQPAQQPKQGGK